MVSLHDVLESNSRIRSTLSPGLVAVFIGGTNGIGEATVRQFAKHAVRPRVYIVGRSKEAGNRIARDCRATNPDGEFKFISRDLSLMRNVDQVCDELKQKESSINILFLTIGTLQTGLKTDEGLHYPAALAVYARYRFLANLLPLMDKAIDLRRVVSVFVAGFEGKVQMDNFQGWDMKLMANRDHAASITTLSLEAHRESHQTISFIHNFPGMVRGGIARDTKGLMRKILGAAYMLFGKFIFMPSDEAGDRHVFLATSARYAAGPEDASAGVPCGQTKLAFGTDGEIASGVYSVDANGEGTGVAVQQFLARLRRERMVDQIRNRIVQEMDEIFQAKRCGQSKSE